MESRQLWKIIIGLGILALGLWFIGYFYSIGPVPETAPAPDQQAPKYSDADRLRVLQSLKSPIVPTATQAEREKALKKLQSTKAKPVSLAERQATLESLKAR